MKRLTIGIDIDGTITDPFYWLDLANEYFGKSVRPEEITIYEIGEVLGLKKEEYIKFYEDKKVEIHWKAGVRQGAKEKLWSLFEDHESYYITARDESLYDLTREWLDEHELPMGKLHTLGSHFKVEKAKELGCDVFIEDRYENAVELAEEGINVLLIDCSYNRQPLIPNMIRVKNWEEVAVAIESLARAESLSAIPERLKEIG